MSDHNRRAFLKGASGAALGALTIGTVASGPALAYNDDFRQEIGQLLSNGKREKARKKLDEEGVAYSMQTDDSIYRPDTDIFDDDGKNIAKESGDGDDEPAISPDTYKKPKDGSDTETTVTIMEKAEDNVYDVTYSWTLDQRTYWADTSNQYNGCGADGAALFWNTNYFSATSVGRSNFDNLGNSRVDYEKWKPGVGGVGAKVDDPHRGDALFEAGFQVELEAVTEGASDQNIVGQYEHTWVGAATPCLGVSVGLSLGPFSLNTSGTPYTWNAAASDRIPNSV